MPRKAPTPCRHPGCAALVRDGSGYCRTHKAECHRDYGRARRAFDSEVGFYQSAMWRKTRAAFLMQHPLCVRCAKEDKAVPAVVVDHIVPVKAGGARFDATNLQPLCVSHHNAKTAAEGRSLPTTRTGLPDDFVF